MSVLSLSPAHAARRAKSTARKRSRGVRMKKAPRSEFRFWIADGRLQIEAETGNNKPETRKCGDDEKPKFHIRQKSLKTKVAKNLKIVLKNPTRKAVFMSKL